MTTTNPDEIVLAPLTDADSPTLFRWINDRELVVFNAPFRPVSQAEHDAWFERIRSQPDVVIYGIRAAGELIGSCQLHSLHPVHRSAELQIRIGDPAWRGKGVGSTAVALLLDVAFRERGLQRVTVHVFADNAAAIRVYEKSGFVREGVLRHAACIEGVWKDVVVMGVLEGEHGRQ